MSVGKSLDLYTDKELLEHLRTWWNDRGAEFRQLEGKSLDDHSTLVSVVKSLTDDTTYLYKICGQILSRLIKIEEAK